MFCVFKKHVIDSSLSFLIKVYLFIYVYYIFTGVRCMHLGVCVGLQPIHICTV